MTPPIFIQRGLSSILKLKHSQRPLKLNSKTSKHQICFQVLSSTLKMEKFPGHLHTDWPPFVYRTVAATLRRLHRNVN